MEKLTNVWIFAEKKDALAELYNGAAQLGEKVTVLFAGDKTEVVGDRVYYLGEISQERILEHYFPSIVQLVEKEKPDLVMIYATKKGRLLTGVLAAAIGTSALVDAVELSVKDGVEARHLVYGGAAFRTEKARGTVVTCVGAGVFDAGEISAHQEITDVPFVEPAVTVRCLEKRELKKEQINLAAAKLVVGVGRGFAASEDLKMAEDFAEAIGGEIACTRPISEGEGWMPKERYIGVSGLILKPDIYFALGISGQVQHTVGINQAKVIVAINKDKNAPIFKQADYGLVGDMYTALPNLIQKAKNK